MRITSYTARFLGSAPGRLRRFRGQRGAALVEYAFTFIFSMTLFLGIMEFGHALYAYHFVNNAAKEATRWAAVNGANCNYDSSCNGTAPMNNGPAKSADVNTFVQNHIPPGIDTTKVTTTACGLADTGACAASTPKFCTTAVGTQPATANAPGCTVEVTVSYSFSFIFPLIPGGPIVMSSTSDMVILH
jgi:Flp pilus assembly protein TadG